MLGSSSSPRASYSSLIRFLGAFGAMILLGAPVARGDLSSTFNDGTLDGWSGVAADGPTTQYRLIATGGVTGGYFDFVDEDTTIGTIMAPSTYLGNWSNVTSLSWDHMIFNTGPDPVSYFPFEADISGPGGSATFTSTAGDSIVGSWGLITAELNPSSWTLNSGTWAGLIADVTSLTINIESVNNGQTPTVADPGDHDGIDNITLSGDVTAVPEPGSLTLLGLGGACLPVAFGYRKRIARARTR